jgi:YYY domain-containing protein
MMKIFRNRSWIIDVLFVGVLMVAAYLRLTGVSWNEDQFLHPDERFMTYSVVARIESVGSLQEYFDTTNSSLNPNNRGASFFVYGTLPVFIVRYTGEALGMTGDLAIRDVGRALSGFADLGVVILVFFTAVRLFDKRVGLLAAAFSALAVMQIQQSHYWAVDNFVNFFSLLALYFAVRVATHGKHRDEVGVFNPWDFVGFGVALGMALASKVSVAPLAVALPLAAAIRILALPRDQREDQLNPAFWWLVLAGAISFVAFRVFQPYAFNGFGIPGWLQNIGSAWDQSAGLGLAERLKSLATAILGLNPHWLDTMSTLAAQISGDADWPPSMQWARRPVWFGLHNIVTWGLGWPLALACFAGFAWAGWRIFRGDWRKPAVVLWSWGLLYFLWQSSSFNPTMRYFLPFYPVLVIFGAWGLVWLWDWGAAATRARKGVDWRRLAQPVAALAGAIALVGAALWAFAFVQVYTQEVSRIQAARWIYQNIPGPVTLNYSYEGGEYKQPLPVGYESPVTPEAPLFINFSPRVSGELTSISFNQALAPMQLELFAGPQSEVLLARINRVVDLQGSPSEVTFALPGEALADPAGSYHVVLHLPEGQGTVRIESAELRSSQLPPESPGQPLILMPVEVDMGESYQIDFANALGVLPDQLVLEFSAPRAISLEPVNVHLRLAAPETGETAFEGDLALQLGMDKSAPANTSTLSLPSPLPMEIGKQYTLELTVAEGSFSLLGAAVANETSWDDGLPLRIDGFDGFGGIYQGDLNFELYWDENVEKRTRMLDILDRADYIFISSSRQWGSLPRLPERFPLAVAYYRALNGCSSERTVEACYIHAQVDNVSSDFGFELVEVFENPPRLGPWVTNDQGAEEAFTVYDHPKVFIFRKTADFELQQWTDYLGQIDLTQVVRLTPKQAGDSQLPNLMLPPDRLEQQREGGTWSEIFDTESWINSSPWVSLIVWYLVLGALGVAVYPIVRWTMPGLRDGGYPFARLVALMLLAWLAWMGASLGLTFTRGWLLAFAALLVFLGGALVWWQRDRLRAEWRARRGLFLRTELLFLGFFAIMLVIRYFNPDLWHPSFGGEKPMDFSYFNAVLRSTSFPPYDPWFSGGYINYYYYGFVLVGAFVKLLGIVPAVAYNLILPTLFAMLALGAYSVAWNLWTAWRERDGRGTAVSPEAVGLSAAVAVLLLGNLGSFAMLFLGFARLGAEGSYTADTDWLTQLQWTLRGIPMAFSGQGLPFGRGDWYWIPTRIIPAANESAPISEFPLFTFAYADLHAHLIALPVTVLALGWSVSAVLSRAWDALRDKWQVAASLFLGGIIIGSLRPINTWDLPTYLAIAILALGYAVIRYVPAQRGRMAPWKQAGLVAGALAVVSVLAYQPFAAWYRQGYSSVELWTGTHTPGNAYITHWGIFLFFIVAWLLWETREWMAMTPLSSLRRLEENSVLVFVAGALAITIMFVLALLGVAIWWFVFPLLLWIGIVFLRPGLDEIKRLIVFLIGTAVFLTLMVEVIRLEGDISRMNTVFKFYLQAWILLAIAAAMTFGWTVDALRRWSPGWRGLWQVGAVFLVACGALFMIMGVRAKMTDRMAEAAPLTLDGMAFMEHSVYFERDHMLELKEDYAAIRWMQENIQGSPVIVQGYVSEYRWGARYTIYTGLPTVLGWNFHQRQQREFVPGNDVQLRAIEIDEFYNTLDLALAQRFLAKYDVEYIVVGQLEDALYPGPGLSKFEAEDGRLWHEVYRDGRTVIYDVADEVLAE